MTYQLVSWDLATWSSANKLIYFAWFASLKTDLDNGFFVCNQTQYLHCFFLCHICQNTPTLWKLLIYTDLELLTTRRKRRYESTSGIIEQATSLFVVSCNLLNYCIVCGVDLFIAKLFYRFHLQVLLLAIYIHWWKYIMQEMVNNETINSAVLFTDACCMNVLDGDLSSNRRRLLCWRNRAWVILSRKL